MCYGQITYIRDQIEIDASHTKTVHKVRYLKNYKKIKVMTKKGQGKYTYDLTTRGNMTLPSPDGDGSYKIRVFENISGDKYAAKQTVTINIKLKDVKAPFLAPNQMVNYSDTSEAIKKAAELTQGLTNDLEKVDVIYDYIISNIKYDTERPKP